MNETPSRSRIVAGAAGAAMLWGMTATLAIADECENRGNEDADFGECRVLTEINSSDGDVGFHWLTDADDLNSTRIDAPNGAKVFKNRAFGPLREQKLTETFGESAEPLCNPNDVDPMDPEDVVTLTEYSELWDAGTYRIRGKGDEGEKLKGEAELTYYLPAAPQELDFDEDDGVISWESGDDLGRCAPADPEEEDTIPVPSPQDLVDEGVLAALPKDVPVIAWEVVLEPEVPETHAAANIVFSTRIAGPGAAVPAGTMYSVTVPADYLGSLPDNTPVKIEVGAIGGDFEVDNGEVEGRAGRPVDDDNATFTEEGEFCVNEVDDGCEEDD